MVWRFNGTSYDTANNTQQSLWEGDLQREEAKRRAARKDERVVGQKTTNLTERDFSTGWNRRSGDPATRRRTCEIPDQQDVDRQMCKHIINAKVSIQTTCCRRWYECPECHDERENHPQQISDNVAFACKTCRKIFVKDLSIYGAEDSACPQCGTIFVLPAVTPEAKVAKLALDILATEVAAEISKF